MALGRSPKSLWFLATKYNQSQYMHHVLHKDLGWYKLNQIKPPEIIQINKRAMMALGRSPESFDF